MNRQVIEETYSKAAAVAEPNLCCSVDYRQEFQPEELAHIPEAVLERNYGCGVPPELKSLQAGQQVLDLGPGLGRDCFIASAKVGPEGRVYGLDMNRDMLDRARTYSGEVAARLGYDNCVFLEGRFDVEIPLADASIDVIFSNCVNNLALDKETAYREMFRVLRPGSKLSFSDIVSRDTIPPVLRENEQAWADCVAGVLSFRELHGRLRGTGFEGISLTPDYLWKNGESTLSDYFSATPLTEAQRSQLQGVRLYSVLVEALKPLKEATAECLWRGQFAMYHGPGRSCQIDGDPDHVFQAGEWKEICDKTAALLKSPAFSASFSVFEAEGEVEPRACLPGGSCC